MLFSTQVEVVVELKLELSLAIQGVVGKVSKILTFPMFKFLFLQVVIFLTLPFFDNWMSERMYKSSLKIIYGLNPMPSRH